MCGRCDLAEERAGFELTALDELARRVGRGEHEVRLHRDLVELGHGVAPEVLGDGGADGVELVTTDAVVVVGRPVPLRERRRGQAVLGHEAGDGLHVRHPGLAAAQAEGHEPVLTGPDLARDPDTGPGPLAPHLGAGEPAHVAHRRDHHGFLRGHVDHLGASRRQGREGGHRRLGPHVGPGRGLGAAHGGTVGVARAVHVPGGRHDAEIARPPARPGAVGPEGGDEDPHRVGGAPGIDFRRARPTGGGEHHVGAGEELDQAGVVVPGQLDGRLSGVPGREPQ